MSNEKRAPLLSDKEIAMIDSGRFEEGEPMFSRDDMRDFYEDLITRGELRVVKAVGINVLGECTECGWDADHRYPFSTCCPGCGNPIAK